MELFFKQLFEPRDLVLHKLPIALEKILALYRGDIPALYKLSGGLLDIISSGQGSDFSRPSFPDASPDHRLKILYVSGMFPSVEHGGGLRMFDILSSLTQRHHVDLYSCFIEDLDGHSYELLANKFCNLRLTTNPLPDINDIAKWLQGLPGNGESYDIIQLEYPTTISLAEGLRPFGKKIGFTFMESISKSAAIDIKNKLFTPQIGPALENFLHCARLEKEISLKADFLIAVSEEDASFIFKISGVSPHIIPTCVSDSFFNEKRWQSPENIEYDAAYVGYFDHTPNIDAMVYYYEHIHKKVRAALPSYRIRHHRQGKHRSPEGIDSRR